MPKIELIDVKSMGVSGRHSNGDVIEVDLSSDGKLYKRSGYEYNLDWEGRFFLLLPEERIEYTFPQTKNKPITLDNIHSVIKNAVCNAKFMGGCSSSREKSGCNTCLFGEYGTKDTFYQLVLDMVEHDNG